VSRPDRLLGPTSRGQPGLQFRSRQHRLGIAWGILGTGVSYEWWAGKHSRPSCPPDRRAPIGHQISVKCRAAGHSPGDRSRAGGALAADHSSYQAVTARPMLVPRGGQPHASSIRTVTGPDLRHRGVGGDAARARTSPPYRCVFRSLRVKAVTFIIVQQGLSASTGLLLRPQQARAMPTPTASDKTDFLRRAGPDVRASPRSGGSPT